MTQAILSLGGKVEIQRLVALAAHVCRPDKYAGKRKKGRLKGALWMEMRLDLATEEALQVSMHDLSLGGVGFWLRTKKVEVGDFLYLRDCSDGKLHPWLKIRVTHCINGIKGFLVGGEFAGDK